MSKINLRGARGFWRLLSIPFAVVVLVATFVLATGSAQASGPRTWVMTVGQQNGQGSIQGMAYGAPSIDINVGDSIQWTSAALEPHTVSFINDAHPATPFNPGISYMVDRTPETSIGAPGEFRNSGILTSMPDPGFSTTYTDYTLQFTGVGTYHYLCYLHGRAMMGTVTVRSAGTAYPNTQGDYNKQALATRKAVIADGNALWSHAASLATPTHIFVGAADMNALVMRYINGDTTVHVGDSITFDMGQNHFPVPHTVTFGNEPPAPFIKVGDPTAFGGGDLNSGVLLPAFVGGPSTFTVTFTTAGSFNYFCMFHDTMGMTGTITVLP